MWNLNCREARRSAVSWRRGKRREDSSDAHTMGWSGGRQGNKPKQRPRGPWAHVREQGREPRSHSRTEAHRFSWGLLSQTRAWRAGAHPPGCEQPSSASEIARRASSTPSLAPEPPRVLTRRPKVTDAAPRPSRPRGLVFVVAPFPVLRWWPPAGPLLKEAARAGAERGARARAKAWAAPRHWRKLRSLQADAAPPPPRPCRCFVSLASSASHSRSRSPPPARLLSCTFPGHLILHSDS